MRLQPKQPANQADEPDRKKLGGFRQNLWFTVGLSPAGYPHCYV